MSREESVDLGVPTPQEEKEAKSQRITHSNPILGAGLAAKLHRVAGASIFDDGHCFLLSASPRARAEDEIKVRTPTTTPRRISRGRSSGVNTTPSILLQIPESESGNKEDVKPLIEFEVGPSSMRRETSRNSQRSVSQMSDLVPNPAPSPAPIGPRRSTRHTRSVSRLSEHDELPSTSGPTTRARSIQPLTASGSADTIDTERSTTPVPTVREGSAAPRRSMRLSMSVGPELRTEEREATEVEVEPNHAPENQDTPPRTSKKHARKPSRGKGKGKAKAKEEEDLTEGEEETVPIVPQSPVQTPGKAISALQARRSLGYGKAQEDTLSCRPTTPEMEAEETEDDDEEDNERTPKKAKVEAEESPKVTGTRKRGSRLSTAGSVAVADDSSSRTQTRSGKRKAEAEEAEVEDTQKVDEGGEKKKEEKEKEAWEGVKKKQKKGWKRFIGL
jgi:hypothetical protein